MQHYAQKSAKANAGFLREYEILLEEAKDKASSEASPASTQESRPGSSILPYDRSRVKFSPLEQGSFSDLSHAWLLPGCSSARDYLAVHGPDKGSLEEFWRVVWDHGVHTIVTLLPCQEKGQVLSEAGWPLEGSPVRTELLTVQRGAEKHVAGWRCIQLKLKHVRAPEGRGAPSRPGGAPPMLEPQPGLERPGGCRQDSRVVVERDGLWGRGSSRTGVLRGIRRAGRDPRTGIPRATKF
nr:receptor-type tyrosine-protein phosphatase H-like [Pelodiscus sinensis]|eukprot:XP_025036845.1 receptor-type tyrosine-protein phosphatase H-like [Pelodiscus sinensis]